VILAAVVRLYLSEFSAHMSHEVEPYKSTDGCLISAWDDLLETSAVSMPITDTLMLYFILWVRYCLAVNAVFHIFATTFLVKPGMKKTRVQNACSLLVLIMDFIQIWMHFWRMTLT
jgi:glucan phosphoethanolaminetransferase (alkaline phosphatase superfamily)